MDGFPTHLMNVSFFESVYLGLGLAVLRLYTYIYI